MWNPFRQSFLYFFYAKNVLSSTMSFRSSLLCPFTHSRRLVPLVLLPSVSLDHSPNRSSFYASDFLNFSGRFVGTWWVFLGAYQLFNQDLSHPSQEHFDVNFYTSHETYQWLGDYKSIFKRLDKASNFDKSKEIGWILILQKTENVRSTLKFSLIL